VPPNYRTHIAAKNDQTEFFDLFAQVQSLHAEQEPDLFRLPILDEVFVIYFNSILSDPNQHLVFARTKNSYAGYVHYSVHKKELNVYRPERRFINIDTLVTADQHQKSGCASFLIQHVKNEAENQNIARLEIDCWSFNKKARQCFEKAGFKLNREFMFYCL